MSKMQGRARHNKLLYAQALSVTDVQEVPGPSRPDPADTLQKLRTCFYDEAEFGNEDSKPYPPECAICLLDWEADDSIKITPCGHAFHE
ncbi:unnamed protein product, partial [Prorocentrum cordatum]